MRVADPRTPSLARMRCAAISCGQARTRRSTRLPVSGRRPPSLDHAPSIPVTTESTNRWAIRAAQTLLVVATLALAGRVVAAQWDGVRDGLGTLAVGWTSLSAVFALAALVAIALSWRAVLADLGSALPLPTALGIFLLAQLGKYLPGGVFALSGQIEVASRSATQPVLALAITGFAAAWLIGFVVVIAPAGFGIREAVLVAVLGGSLAAGSSAAIVVAGVSRLLLVVCDIVLAGLGLLLGSSPERHRRDARS